MSEYDTGFFDYVNLGAIRSARRVVPLLQDLCPIASVLDVGCGEGAWLAVWRDLGVADTVGVDGDYVDPSRLLIPPEAFHASDLAEPLSLGRRFDVVQSLEVAEHLPDSAADAFIQSLVRHSDIIVFSAAPPGQGGDHHVNERPYDYWKSKFEGHGYVAVDCVRPQLEGQDGVEPWYRYNTFIYVHHAKLADLPPAAAEWAVPEHQGLRDLSPTIYKVRKFIVKWLPIPVVTLLAKMKERLVVRRHRAGASR